MKDLNGRPVQQIIKEAESYPAAVTQASNKDLDSDVWKPLSLEGVLVFTTRNGHSVIVQAVQWTPPGSMKGVIIHVSDQAGYERFQESIQ